MYQHANATQQTNMSNMSSHFCNSHLLHGLASLQNLIMYPLPAIQFHPCTAMPQRHGAVDYSDAGDGSCCNIYVDKYMQSTCALSRSSVQVSGSSARPWGHLTMAMLRGTAGLSHVYDIDKFRFSSGCLIILALHRTNDAEMMPGCIAALIMLGR